MKRSRTKLALLAFLGMMSVVNAWAQDVVKNTTTNTSYATLQEAFYDASQGDVIELLGDVDATGDEEFSDDFNLGIEESITLKGNNHTLTVNRRGISVARQSSNSRMMGAPAKASGNTINVTIQDLTIKNVAAQVKRKGGQIINTRGGIGTLTLNNVTFDTQNTAYNGDVRPLVIGGSQSTAATVNITNCTFTNLTAPTGKNSIAINVLNPVTMNIQSTTINAQYVINLGGADSSYGSQGSEVTFNGSTVNASAGAAVLFDADDTGSGANGSTVTLAGETKVTTPIADWYDLGNTENTIVWEHFATNFISATKYETKPTIQIATVADLQALATLCNSSSTSGQTAGNTYELTADLDLSGVAWTPAGGLDSYPGTSFKGTFDGKEHTISNLTCTDTHANYATAALFGAVKNAVIKNLTLKDVNINSTHYAAAFVAYKADGTCTIDNCHVDGGSIVSTPELLGSSYDNGDKVGAIVGYVNSADITNCSVNGVTIQGYRDLGGLAGYMAGGTVTDNTVADVTIIQSDENGYKTNSDGSLQDMTTTVGEVVGGRSGAAVKEQANDPSKNVAENVTIESTGVLAKIGNAKFSTISAAVAAATEGQTVEIYVADTYTLPNLPANITIKGAVEGVVFNHTSAGNIASVPNGATFENVTFNFGNVNYHGFQHAGKITMNDCTLNGRLSSYGDMEFVGCTFNAPGTEESGITSKDYSMWAYSGNLTYTDCTFNCNGKCINVYNEDGATLYTVTAKNCTFNSETANKAAFNVKATCGTTPLKFKVIIEDCEATGSWPAASVSETLVVLNALAQVDDINSEVASDIEVMEIEDGVETLHYPARVAEYNGTRYNTLAEALDAAEAANDENIVINLLNDAELTIAAWSGSNNRYAIGTAETETITINGNEHKLTFMTTDTDWNNVATMNDAQTKLVLNNMTLDQGGRNTNGTWNAYDINFNCAVELNNVTSNRPIALKNDAALNNVTINVDESKDVYGLWIQTNGQSVSIDGLTMNVPSGRAIAVKDQYVNTEPATTTALTITNASFTTAKKAAILVTAKYGAKITASSLDITNVAADSENAVWVDKDLANKYGEITFNSTDETMIPEGGVDAYSVVRKTGEKVEGYYKVLPNALADAEADQTIELKADFELSETKNSVETPVYFVANDHKVTLAEGVIVYTKENTYDDVFTTADAAVSSIEVTETANGYAYEATAVYYAQVGDNKYRTLQDAVDAAQALGGTQTITLLKDISGETVTIKEVANFQLTIDGKKDDSSNYTVDALIVVDGLRGNGGSTTNGASVTLQNIAFVKTTATDGIQATHYPHNLTIQDCTYVGSDNSKWFFNASVDGPLYGVTIKNVTVENARLIYANLADDAVFQNITATTDCTAGFNVKTSGTVLIENCQVTTAKYAFRDYNDGYAGTFTLKDNTFISTSTGSDEGVIVNRGGADGEAQINVESGTYAGDVKVLNGKTALNISGGTFTVEVPSEYIAEGYGLTDNGDGTYTVYELPYVAQVGETNYKSLQKALDAAHEMTGDVTITLLEDISGYAIVHQKAGLNLTIDGADKTLAGQIFIDGNGRASGTETLIIQNIKFEGNTSNFYSGTDAFILVPSTKDTDKPWTTGAYNYAHNITVTDCSFTSTSTSNAYDVVCIKATSGAGAYNVVINNCTATGTMMHSLAQLTATTGGAVTNCTVTGSESFVNVSGGGGEFTVSGNTFTSDESATDGYGIRENSSSAAIITLTDNNFKAAVAVKLGKGGSATNGTINVVSGTYMGDIVKDIAATATGKIAISGGHFSVDLSQDAYKDFIANLYYGESNLYPETPEAPNGVKHYPFVIVGTEAETGYATFAEAVADVQDGETIQMLDNVTMDADLTSTMQDGESFAITFGDYSIEQNGFFLKLNTGVSVTTDKETDLFAPVNATDMITVSGTYTYKAESKESQGIYELVDGTACPYALESDVTAEKVTYTRKISGNLNYYTPWFVPFDYTIKDEDAENFTFFKINMIANASGAGEAEASNEVWVFVVKMNPGDKLHGNKPYVFKAKKAGTYEFVSEDVTLKARTSDYVLQTATTTDTYSFYGTYETTPLEYSPDYRDLYMAAQGKLSYPTADKPTINLGAYRWYIHAESKEGVEYARSISFIEGDGQGATGIENTVTGEETPTYYTLDGVQVKVPGKGIYIMRYANGKTKKVSIK